MRPEDLRGMQLQISDVLRDCASRIRNGGDLATVQKVLGEVQESAAEWLRQTGEGNGPTFALREHGALAVHAEQGGGVALSLEGEGGGFVMIHLSPGGALKLTSDLMGLASRRLFAGPAPAGVGVAQEIVHLDAPGGAACADPSEDIAVHASLDAVTCAACRAARAAEDAPGVHPLARWLARNVVLQDGVSLAIAARVAEPRRPYLGESRLAYWTALIEQAGPPSGPAFVSVAEVGSGEAPRQLRIKPTAGLAGLVLALVAQYPERAAEILRLAPGDSK